MPTEPRFKAQIFSDISDIPAETWNSMAGDNPFMQHAFLHALENSGCVGTQTGWQQFHIEVTEENNDKPLGYMPLYVKSHSSGEYVFDHAWANAFENAGGSYYPKLQSSVPFTPVTGPRLMVASGAPDGVQEALLQAVSNAAVQHKLSSAHITFMHKAEAEEAKKSGYLIRTGQQFHWQNSDYSNFDDFLAQLSSRKRKQIKKERRTATSSGITFELLEGADIKQEHWDVFFSFYIDTGARKWGQPYLNREFFTQIGKSMPEQLLLILCKLDGQYIAGALNFKSEHTLYGRYWGCLEDHPCLHFETCYYQAIDYAIKHGMASVEAGAQGPHKLARGYSPVVTYSAHFIANPSFKDAIAEFLLHERDAVDAEVKYLEKRTPFKKHRAPSKKHQAPSKKHQAPFKKQ